MKQEILKFSHFKFIPSCNSSLGNVRQSLTKRKTYLYMYLYVYICMYICIHKYVYVAHVVDMYVVYVCVNINRCICMCMSFNFNQTVVTGFKISRKQ